MTTGESEPASLSQRDIGAEHQRMGELIQALTALIRDRTAAEAVLATARELLRYSELHFGHEKELMERSHYPNAYAHLWEHRDLLDKLAMLIHSLEGSGAVATPHVVEFIDRWFIDHVKGSDAELGAFLAGLEPAQD